MDIIVLVGRVLFAFLFAFSAFGHFAKPDMYVGYMKSKGVPAPALMNFATGAVLAFGSISVLFGIWGDLGSLLLIAFLVPSAFLIHNFWTVEDPMAKGGEQAQFSKNIALAGAALMLFAFFAHTPELGLTLTGPLFSIS